MNDLDTFKKIVRYIWDRKKRFLLLTLLVVGLIYQYTPRKIPGLTSYDASDIPEAMCVNQSPTYYTIMPAKFNDPETIELIVGTLQEIRMRPFKPLESVPVLRDRSYRISVTFFNQAGVPDQAYMDGTIDDYIIVSLSIDLPKTIYVDDKKYVVYNEHILEEIVPLFDGIADEAYERIFTE